MICWLLGTAFWCIGLIVVIMLKGYIFNYLMKTFLLINTIFTALNFLVIVYAFSLQFFSEEIKKKWKQDTFVGLVLIFLTMLCCFLWIIYIYYLINI